MKSLTRKSIGLGIVLTMLAGPALAQPFYNGGDYNAPRYSAPRHDMQHERREAMWRAHERHQDQERAAHAYAYGYDSHRGY
jgi:hypothetical protein